MNSPQPNRPILLCLHGWGGSKESFDPLRAALHSEVLDILTPDLPGFGAEPEPSRPWNTDDYVDWVETFIKKNIGDRPYLLLAHSHGGRIAIKMLVRGSVRPPIHLFLCAPAGIRHPRHFKRIFGLTLAKTGKFFLSIPGLASLSPLGKKLLYRLVRVHDYEKASPLMRETLILVTREDLRSLLPKISIGTDLFWGEDDRMTPITDAAIFQKAIPTLTVHRYPGVRHGVHKDRATEIAAVIRPLLA
jgi:pimeloyl-ACP methyl ester carboxylesterase